jgi:hypothetical protein
LLLSLLKLGLAQVTVLALKEPLNTLIAAQLLRNHVLPIFEGSVQKRNTLITVGGQECHQWAIQRPFIGKGRQKRSNY